MIILNKVFLDMIAQRKEAFLAIIRSVSMETIETVSVSCFSKNYVCRMHISKNSEFFSRKQ